jgi:hypothetical protein
MQTEQPLDHTPENGAVTKTPTQARQGVKLGTMRWGISMALAVVGVAIAYFVA